PKTHFTIGIYDDVTHLSLDWDSSFRIDEPGVISGVFYGLGSDGTVGANKNSIKIIGENTDNFAQAYFVYDSKKAGAVTISHLRFGPNPIRSTYLIQDANFVACHQFSFLERYDVLRLAAQGATFLLNSPYSAETVWDYLPRTMQETIIDKELHFFVVDAVKVARETKMGRRINTILQTCFFALSGILPRDKAIEEIKTAIEKTYSKRGAAIIQSNFAAVDMALSHLAEVSVPSVASSNFERRPIVPEYAPEFVQSVTARMIEGVGDLLPVSALPADGTYMSGTTQYEKRNIADEIPVWDTDLCIQCGKCVFVCPHAVIRQKVFDPETLEIAPAAFKS
ncbi:MAG: 2-oxoacid:acceptor oxidoreductase family protein, partial [Methylococcales bacterium]|nr:2-oxoacid:acceptor oxidoreductase family protein [Methylococcales bacterium]